MLIHPHSGRFCCSLTTPYIKPKVRSLRRHSLALPDDYLRVGGTNPQDGQSSGFILKTDLQGNPEWNSTYAYHGEASSINSVSVADGGFMFVGHAVPNPLPPKSDTWVAIDSSGKILDELAIPMGNHRSTPASLIQGSDGGYVFVGIWNQDESLDQKFWVVKVSG